jgi:hypothetical protein
MEHLLISLVLFFSFNLHALSSTIAPADMKSPEKNTFKATLTIKSTTKGLRFIVHTSDSKFSPASCFCSLHFKKRKKIGKYFNGIVEVLRQNLVNFL